MRIYSKVSDYYDNVRAFGIDPNCVFVRKERVLNIVGNDKDYDAFNVSPQLKLMIENGNKYNFYSGVSFFQINFNRLVVLFCGKAYPIVSISKPFDYKYENHDYSDVICHSIGDVDKYAHKFLNKKQKEIYFNNDKKSSLFKKNPRNNFLKYFTNWPQEHESFIKLHIDNDTPIMLFDSNRMTVNPVLQDLDFYRVIDHYSAFQELSMFISGVMGGQSPKMIDISDDIRLEKHGFDKKISFRKRAVGK